MHITTQKIYKILSTVVIVVAVFVASYAFATLGGPTQNPPAGNRSPFLNTGPIEQAKAGRLDIGSANSATVAFSVDGGVANLIDGINVTNTTTTAATIDAPMYVGYSGVGVEGTTPATLEINNRLRVAGTIRDTSLAHPGNTLAPVCVNADGVLIPCTAQLTIPAVTNCAIMNYSSGTAVGTHDSIGCNVINDSNGAPVSMYEFRMYDPWWGITLASTLHNDALHSVANYNSLATLPHSWQNLGTYDATPAINSSTPTYFRFVDNMMTGQGSYAGYFWGDMDRHRVSVRGVKGTTVGPWTDFNTQVSVPGPVPTFSITATPSTINTPTGSTVLRWTTTGTSSCVANSTGGASWSGPKNSSNTVGETVSLTGGNASFWLTCNVAGLPPISSAYAHVYTATGTWAVGPWGACSNAQKTRSVTCPNGVCPPPTPVSTVNLPNTCTTNNSCTTPLPGGGTLTGVCNLPPTPCNTLPGGGQIQQQGCNAITTYNACITASYGNSYLLCQWTPGTCACL